MDPKSNADETVVVEEEASAVDLLDDKDEPEILDSRDGANVPVAPGENEFKEDDPVDFVDDQDGKQEEEVSTPFQDEGGFDKDDDSDVELFDDEAGVNEADTVPLAGAVDGQKKKRRRIFKRKKTTTTETKEPSKAEKRRRRRAICLLICCCLLLLLIILLLIFLVFRDGDDPNNDINVADDDGDDGFVDDFFGFGDGLVPDSVQTTPFDPFVKDDCDFSDNFQPHVISQCECYGKISVVADDIRELYSLIKTRLMPELYTDEGEMWDEPITSCDPRNQALLWLSSGDTRRGGDLVQRFLTSTAYIAMNGTKWDYQNLWLSDQNECLWLGLQCNKRFQIHSLALDTINIFGTVCTLFVWWLRLNVHARIDHLFTSCSMHLPFAHHYSFQVRSDFSVD